MKIQYYAVALNEQHHLAQVLVTRENGKHSQTFTGKTYKTRRSAESDITTLNCSVSKVLTRSQAQTWPTNQNG